MTDDRNDTESGRQRVAVGCIAVVVVSLFFIGAGVAVVAFFLGVDVLAHWVVSLIEPLTGPPFYAVTGAALILFSAWALVRLATGHAPPSTSRRDMILAVLVVIGVAVFGVGVLVAAFAPPAPAPGF